MGSKTLSNTKPETQMHELTHQFSTIYPNIYPNRSGINSCCQEKGRGRERKREEALGFTWILKPRSSRCRAEAAWLDPRCREADLLPPITMCEAERAIDSLNIIIG